MTERLTFDVTLRRPGFSLQAKADLATSEVIGIIGPSGAGKSSLMRCLAGLEPACRGRIDLQGECWLDTRRSIRLPAEKRGVGMVFQQPSLFTHLSVAANLDYAWQRTPLNERRITPAAAAGQLRITPLLDRMPTTLSGGEAQRVAIARALVSNPRLLMLDEPLAAVDTAGRREVMQCLEQLRGQHDLAMLYVSHALDEVARMADRLLLMEAGQIVAEGPVAEMLTRLDLPLAREPDAEALLEGHVTGHDEAEKTTLVNGPFGDIILSKQSVEVGSLLRLRIRARDVSVALSHASDSSIQNILPANVTEIVETLPGQCMLRLDVAGQVLLARITRRSVWHLKLQPGTAVYAQIKSVALA